jgi:hypothetical protein
VEKINFLRRHQIAAVFVGNQAYIINKNFEPFLGTCRPNFCINGGPVGKSGINPPPGGYTGK